MTKIRNLFSADLDSMVTFRDAMFVELSAESSGDLTPCCKEPFGGLSCFGWGGGTKPSSDICSGVLLNRSSTFRLAEIF